MSVDPISSTSNSSQWTQTRNDFQSLSQALQTGNLTAAQKAYSSIQQAQQSSGRQLPANSQAATDFNTLGQDLQSGNLAGAQQTFASLQTDLQSLRQSGGGQGHHHGGGGDSDQDGSSSSSSTTPNASKTITNETTLTNPDGTITITTTYSDGTTSSDTEPNPTPPVSSQNPLAPNGAQLATLLNAQEQASKTS